MINRVAVRRNIARSLRDWLVDITLCRRDIVSDGHHGFIDKGEKEVGSYQVYLNTASRSVTVTSSDAGINKVMKPNTVMTIFSEDINWKDGDYFTHNDLTYTLENVQNLYDIVITAEITSRKSEDYGGTVNE